MSVRQEEAVKKLVNAEALMIEDTRVGTPISATEFRALAMLDIKGPKCGASDTKYWVDGCVIATYASLVRVRDTSCTAGGLRPPPAQLFHYHAPVVQDRFPWKTHLCGTYFAFQLRHMNEAVQPRIRLQVSKYIDEYFTKHLPLMYAGSTPVLHGHPFTKPSFSIVMPIFLEGNHWVRRLQL